jgi:undecaprenyl-diphosphatase
LRLINAGIASVVGRRIGDDPDRKLAWYLVIGTIPAGLAGLFAEPWIESIFYSPDTDAGRGRFIAMAGFLVAGGLALWAADSFGRQRRRLEQLTLADVILIGMAQAMAILPGVSRSGSTMMAGLALRLERPAAARFSFLLSAPIIAAVCLKKMIDLVQEIRTGNLAVADLTVFAIGVLASFVSGYFCIRFLLRFLQTNSTAIFAIYRCIVAVFILWIAFQRP